MAITQVVTSALRDTKVRRRTAGSIRRAVLVLGATGLTLGAGLLTAGSALASAHGSQPGRLTFHPASGAVTLKPTFSTSDGCPTGFQGSAEVSEFNTNGSFASRISYVVSPVVSAFKGILDGAVGPMLHVTNIKKGGTVEFAVGCYSLVGGTGNVRWVQATFLTLSSTGKSFTTSSAPPASATALQLSPSQQQQASSSAKGQQTSAAGQTDSAYATKASGGGTQLEAGLIAGACGLVVAVLGIAWYRRRDRSRLM
jgi:hypothetical protein